MLGGEQRSEQAGHEGRRRVGHVCIEEGDDVTGGGGQGCGHGLALAAGPAGSGHHGCPRVTGLFGGVVARAVVEHDDLVDEPVSPVSGQEGLDDRPDHRAHRGALVAGGNAHRDSRADACLGLEHGTGGEVTVVIGLRHAPDSSSLTALGRPARAGYHSCHHPERLRDGPVDVAATSALRETVEHLVPMPDR